MAKLSSVGDAVGDWVIAEGGKVVAESVGDDVICSGTLLSFKSGEESSPERVRTTIKMTIPITASTLNTANNIIVLVRLDDRLE